MKYLSLALCLLMLPVVALAEPIQISYDEPTGQAATLAETCVRFCDCKQALPPCLCTDLRRPVCTPGTNGGDGGSTINLNPALIWPVYEGDQPLTVRACVNSKNTSGNETDRFALCKNDICFGATCP